MSPRSTSRSKPPEPAASAHDSAPKRAGNVGLALLGLAFLVALGLSLYLVLGLVGSGQGPWNALQNWLSIPALAPWGNAPVATGQPALAPQGWTGESRVSILLMGVDSRQEGPGQGPGLTDTMILISLDPVAMTAGILSIPRDLWVNIPGFGNDKINKAYFDGEANRLPGGGPALAMQTVHNFLGVPVQYYVVVDFFSFTTLIDDIGGIDVKVPETTLRIHPLGPAKTVRLHQGLNHLDGATALAYARDRDTPGGDFDRARRQQQVIYAVRDKVLSLNMLPTLVVRAPQLYRAVAGGLQTDLTLSQILALAWTAKGIPSQNIASGIIGPDQLQSISTVDGLEVLLPDLRKARALANQVLNASGAPASPAPTLDPAAIAPKEGAQIELVNGSGAPGLAAATRDYLVRHGFSADKISLADAPIRYPSTQVIDFRGMPYTVGYLVELMHVSPSNELSQQAGGPKGTDVQVILGTDWQVPSN
jgi:LCP family protein required for cell wall assembly